MQFNTEIAAIFDKYMQEKIKGYIHHLGEKQDMDVSVLSIAWQEFTNVTPAATAAAMTTEVKNAGTKESPSPPPAPTQQQIMNANASELKAMCKALKLPCGGKKQDLMDRILSNHTKEGVSDTSSGNKDAVKEVKKPKGKKRSPNRMPSIPTSSIQITKNVHGNYEHADTKLVFNKDTKTVIGKQHEDGSVLNLTDTDIQQCDQFKFAYIIPEKITNREDREMSKSSKPDIVETLDDIIANSDDEEEFEEFFEDDETLE